LNIMEEIISDVDSFEYDSDSEVSPVKEPDINQLSKDLEYSTIQSKTEEAPAAKVKSGMEVEDMEFEVVEEKKEKPIKKYGLSRSARRLLEEWKNTTKYGKFIEGTNILPMKTPLMKRKWLENMKQEENFSLIRVIEEIRQSGKKIGAVIDLRPSRRNFYDWDYHARRYGEVLKGIDYRKITYDDPICDRAELNKVFDALNKHHFKDQVILIHSPNGINRVGHAVCYFLCKRLNMKPDEAVRKFEEARGYPIDKKAIIEDLKDRFE